MKKIVLFLVFLLIAPVAFADITITTDQPVYNLGNRIKVSASVLQDDSFEGLFKLTLSCGNYKLQYFLSPISLEPNFRTAVAVPDLTTTPQMLGDCTIIGDLATNDNLAVEEKESNSFNITTQLSVLPVKKNIVALPADSIAITGVLNEAFGNNVAKASAKIVLDNNSYTIEAADGKFSLDLPVSKNIKSGKHTIDIGASDSKGNAGASSIEMEITAVPTYIKNELSESKLLPGSKIDATSGLYDQADDLINVSLNLELTSPKGDKVFIKSVQSNEKLTYEFSQYAEPGIYTLASSYKSLLAQSSINITAIREVKVTYENESVFVENTGNVPFLDELTFILQSELKKYPITKKVSIDPGKLLSIDLSREVPEGIYNVILPLKESLNPITETIGDAINDLSPEEVLANSTTIHDNRPIYRKIATGLGSISGNIVGADGLLTKNPLIAPMILIGIVLIVAFRYGRKPLMRLIKGKKDDEN